MARLIKPRERKPYIIVFWEGESEKEYMKFIRSEFHEYLNLTIHPQKGTFYIAKKAFSSKGKYSDDIADVDEIWFIFDTEPGLRNKWDEIINIIKQLRNKCKYMTTRMLMTKGCIEYYFLLHFEKCAPLIVTTSDKINVLHSLKDKFCNEYKKGDPVSIREIAKHYNTALENGAWCLNRLVSNIGKTDNMDERDHRLFITDQTFTNVHEGIAYLISLKEKENDYK